MRRGIFHKKRLQHARESIHKEKLQMLWWLKSGQVSQQQEIGKRLGRDTSTVTRWLQKYRRGGLVIIPLVQPAHSPELNPIEQFGNCSSNNR